MKINGSNLTKASLAKLGLTMMIGSLAACGGGSSSNSDDKASAENLTSHVFTANNGVDGKELFISNGTEAGTEMLKDINASGGSDPENFIKMGGNTFFVADDNIHGEELWKTDGTTAGTVLVKDIEVGSSSSPRQLTVFKGKLYFVAFQSASRNEMWVSDGTESGTSLFKDVRTGSFFDGQISGMTVVGDNLLFSAVGSNSNGQELWVSDGTAAGTVILKNINPGAGGVGSHPQDLTLVGSTLFFTADDGSGRALWKSDGTAVGTVKLNTAGLSTSPTSIDDMTAVGNQLFFSATTTNEGNELWTSDGTVIGTKMVKNIRAESSVPKSSAQKVLLSSGGNNSNPSDLTAVGNNLFFTANDGINNSQLWKSDGNAKGTVLVKNIDTSANPTDLFAVGNTLLFTASVNGGSKSIWRSDGTESGTVSVVDTTGSGNSNRLTSIGKNQYLKEPLLFVNSNTVLISADSGNNDVQLFKTDGTAAGTVQVKRINLVGDAF